MAGEKRSSGKKKKQNSKRVRVVVAVIMFWIFLILGIVMCLMNFLGFGEVVFSHRDGFYDDSISVSIKTNGLLTLQSLTIKYNMNGDYLTNTSQVFDGEIVLAPPETGYKLYTITAAACLNDDNCTKTKTATYVVGKNLSEDITLKIVNLNSAWENLYDYNKGIMVGGVTYDYNEAVGQIKQSYIRGNYNNRDDKWLRDAHMTMFDVNGDVLRSEDVLLGISGGTSSSYAVKSLKIETLPDKNEEIEEFRLRSGSQDQFGGNIRSSVVSRLINECGFDFGTNTERIVVFLNGDFYGIFDLQDNYSNDNLAKRFNLTKKSRIEKYKSSENSVFKSFGISLEEWDNLDEPEKRKEIEELLDMDDYLKYFAVQILINNTDWPMNNFEGWRYVGKKTNNKYEDGRIRFLLYDTDLIYYKEGNVEWFDGTIGDIFEYLMEGKNNGRGSTFYKVMESEYYRDKFIKLLDELIKGPFAADNVVKIIDEEANKIERQEKLFFTQEEYEKWEELIELMREAVREREDTIRNDVKKYFDVEL